MRREKLCKTTLGEVLWAEHGFFFLTWKKLFHWEFTFPYHLLHGKCTSSPLTCQFELSLAMRVPLNQMPCTINEVLNICYSFRHPTSLIFPPIFWVLTIYLFPTRAKLRYFYGNIQNMPFEFNLTSRKNKIHQTELG